MLSFMSAHHQPHQWVVTLLVYTKDLADADTTFSFQRVC